MALASSTMVPPIIHDPDLVWRTGVLKWTVMNREPHALSIFTLSPCNGDVGEQEIVLADAVCTYVGRHGAETVVVMTITDALWHNSNRVGRRSNSKSHNEQSSKDTIAHLC